MAVLANHSLLDILGENVGRVIFTLNFVHRRHIEVGELWIQDAVRIKVLTVNKVKGEDNPADILTKYIEQGKIHQHCHGMRLVPEVGRPDSAPATTG